jgi:hypothetical protein
MRALTLDLEETRTHAPCRRGGCSNYGIERTNEPQAPNALCSPRTRPPSGILDLRSWLRAVREQVADVASAGRRIRLSAYAIHVGVVRNPAGHSTAHWSDTPPCCLGAAQHAFGLFRERTYRAIPLNFNRQIFAGNALRSGRSMAVWSRSMSRKRADSSSA